MFTVIKNELLIKRDSVPCTLCFIDPMKEVQTECNRTINLTPEQPKAFVTSPGFPRAYPDNVECYTDITALPGYQIILDFEELVLENEPL